MQAIRQTKLPFRRPQRQDAPDQMRRLGDVVIASVLLVLTLPLMLLVAVAIRCESSGPALERQTCICHGGRRCQILKFRTAKLTHGPVWARKPTPFGQFLRQTRIDVLPQLINVLRGEMSLVDRHARSPSFLD